jgi:hypothetical protein
MASRKGRKGLDQPNGQTLSALDRALAEFADYETLKPDEFTVQMVADKNPGVPRTTMAHRFDELVRKGVMDKRKLIVGGKVTCAYRYV